MAEPLLGVFCPDGFCFQTYTDPMIAWHHAERANEKCPHCGGGIFTHSVRGALHDSHFLEDKHWNCDTCARVLRAAQPKASSPAE